MLIHDDGMASALVQTCENNLEFFKVFESYEASTVGVARSLPDKMTGRVANRLTCFRVIPKPSK